ncbi:MAG: Flp pilus assembly complex ATPase component TadA [Candidatus Aenigmarchaeota archaeon]|nr:Flp pilus assembly complex ATPase component TadA [Candidatus Aenigmarchaeota archaeon]
MNKIVPDTSVLISGIISGMIEKKEMREAEIIIPEFVIEALRAQASKGREIGFRGLEEIKRLRSMENDAIKLVRTGRRQTMEEIQLAKYGRIDALILDIAKEENATLFTSDYVQATVAEAEKVSAKYFPSVQSSTAAKLSELLTPDTMSLHIKEGTPPMAKKGKPGNFSLVKITDEIFTTERIEMMIKEVMDAARYDSESFVEVGGHAASVVQLGDMRIVIARPPFSDGVEMTVVRPITRLSLKDYDIPGNLMERLEMKAEGILIAGPPGSGKSTFAAALAEFFEMKGKIVKTMESPRDLQVGKGVTQYSKLRGSFENTADILLLVRPDYTIFDEVRKTEEFITFSDMRLSGIGMVGVVHATDPVDAVQRFISRVELGIVPHIVDTIIYIKDGRIGKTYLLDLVVRTPTGMTESDLARPVVEIRDFSTGGLEYEIYTYGEENVIIPVKSGKKESAMAKLAKKQIMSEISKFDRLAEVEMTGDDKIAVRVDNDAMPRIIGRSGSTIKHLEERLGVRIEVLPKVSTFGKETGFEVEETGAYVCIRFDERQVNRVVNFYSGNEYIFSATVGKKGLIKVNKDSDAGRSVMKAVLRNELKAFA